MLNLRFPLKLAFLEVSGYSKRVTSFLTYKIHISHIKVELRAKYGRATYFER
jgi:hypothetical protein